MKSEDIRRIMALQAIEQADENQLLLSDSDYREAASNSGAPLPKKVGTGEANTFLSRRAETLLIRLTSRFPETSKWVNPQPTKHRLGLLALGLFIVAAIAGFLTNELGPEKRINILSFPLLGIMLWSLVVYLREIALLLKKRQSLREGGKTAAIVDLLQPPPGTVPASDSPERNTIEGARVIFEKRWRKLNAPAIGARLKSILHTTAMILAAAAIAGMYVKGLANEYRAVWESTFFSDSTQLRPFLNLILGPASSLTGEAIPSVEALDKIHWEAGEVEMAGENAARWIHWYAITISLFVIIPRALLGFFWRVKASQLERTLPFREVSADYYEHLLAVSTGSSLTISLVPYPVSPSEASRRQILRTLEDHFEKPVEVIWIAAVPFGEEEEPVSGLDGEVIPLFDFSATPEKETHLALYQTLSGQSDNPVRCALLETSSFDRKMRELPDGEERKEARMKAWKNLFETVNVELLVTTISKPPEVTPTA